MNRSSLFSAAALGALALSALAGAPPAADAQAVASAAAQKDIVQVLQTRESNITPSKFSRTIIIPYIYSVATVSSAPDGVVLSAEKIPFEIRRVSKFHFEAGGSPFNGDAKPATPETPQTYLSGYYDTAAKTLRLYDTKAKAYVAAAEHPFMK